VSYGLYSGDLPAGVTLLEDGSFDGLAGNYGTFEIVVEVCDDGDPRACATYYYTIVVRPATLVDDVDSNDDSGSAGPGSNANDPNREVISPSALPFTGIETSDLLIAGLVLLAVGALVVRFGKVLEPDDFDATWRDS
jgi:LPXTG-motif cell wall-anchored protein